MTRKAPATEYVVLEMHVVEIENHNQKLERVEAWRVVGRVSAASTERKTIEAVVGDRAGTFKAVAARSWKGGEVRVEQTSMVSRAIEEKP